MRVALDISPTKSGHQVRGIGSYTKNLQDQLLQQKEITFKSFDDPFNPPDADIVHYPYFDLFFRTLPKKSNSKRIVTIHDVIPLVFPDYFPIGLKGSINFFFQKKALKNSDAVICDSKTSKSDIIQKLNYPSDKIFVIYLAPSPDYKKLKTPSTKVSTKYNLPKNYVLYVGDINWNKNIINLLSSVKIAKVNIVMVGKALLDEKIIQNKQINEQIKNLDIEDKVFKTGYLSDNELVEIYNNALATLQPSFYEGFGLPVLESMACGTPVVCSNVASIAEIAGNDAIFCDPTSVKAIASAIKKAINLNEKDKKSLSDKLIKHASSFTWDKVAQQTIAVYHKVLDA